jgi:hypothetical protein
MQPKFGFQVGRHQDFNEIEKFMLQIHNDLYIILKRSSFTIQERLKAFIMISPLPVKIGDLQINSLLSRRVFYRRISMKNRYLSLICLIVIISFTISACGQLANSDGEQDPNLVNTMVALAFTQTAVAQPPAGPEQAADTPAPVPEPETVEEVVEVVAEPETAEPTEITHNLIPGEPGWINKWFYDTDASRYASSGYVVGGDDFVANLWERPFTETEMVYRPDLDINKTEMSEDGNFYYVTIYPHAVHPDGGLPGFYGIEIDIDKDGRGDLLVTAQNPASSTWDIAGVGVFKDNNNDVGGSAIMRPDTSYGGDGYEQVVFSADVLDDPDAAWARSDLGAPSVTMAFKKSLLGGPTTFVWGVWAAESLLDPAMLDLHDHFTQSEAGSPYQAHSTYPLKAINLVDNTCRETYGFEATVPIPGLCQINIQPTATPTNPPQPGSITAGAFFDINFDGVKQAIEGLWHDSYVIFYLHSGSCASTAMRTSSVNPTTFTLLPPGTYCVTIEPLKYLTSSSSTGVFTLDPGAAITVWFGYYPTPY